MGARGPADATLTVLRPLSSAPTCATLPGADSHRLCKRCDLYNTRHTFATHALASGEDPGWVAKMLGHTTLQMIFTTYYRYLPNLVRRDGMMLAKQLARRRNT